jgi:Rad3-related DNA helicase
MENAIKELKSFSHEMLALALGSKSNLCIHKGIKDETTRANVETQCRKLTLTDIEESARCKFYDGYIQNKETCMLQRKVYTLHDLKQLGHELQICPYFLAKHFIVQADVVVISQSCMIDPKLKGIVRSKMDSDAIVVFDDCTEIDNDCVDSFSLHLNRNLLEQASNSLKQLEEVIKAAKGSKKLEDEYIALV